GEVYLARYGSSQGYRATTIADGTIILEGVVPGTYEVQVGCKGYLSELPYPDLTIATTDLADLVWHVAEGARVTRTVVDEVPHVPTPKAMVNHSDPGGLEGGTAVADEHGAFAIEGVTPGFVDLSAHAEGSSRSADGVRVTATLAA